MVFVNLRRNSLDGVETAIVGLEDKLPAEFGRGSFRCYDELNGRQMLVSCPC